MVTLRIPGILGTAECVLALLLPACSGPQTSHALTASPAVVVSSGDFYAALSELPTTGDGSLATLIAQLGQMSLPQYFKDQLALAPNYDLSLDGIPMANPRAALLASEKTFAALSARYGTMADFWQATGGAPDTLGTLDDYQTNLAASLGVTKPATALALDGKSGQVSALTCALAAQAALQAAQTFRPAGLTQLNLRPFRTRGGASTSSTSSATPASNPPSTTAPASTSQPASQPIGIGLSPYQPIGAAQRRRQAYLAEQVNQDNGNAAAQNSQQQMDAIANYQYVDPNDPDECPPDQGGSSSSSSTSSGAFSYSSGQGDPENGL